MIIPDINLLLYAHITSFPLHPLARQWWEELMNGETAVGIAPPVLYGFVRVVTNRRVFDPPMAVDTAIDHVASWLEQPHVRFMHPGPRHLEIAFGLLRRLGTAANLTTDAQLAAFAIEHQGELHSADTDFGRFPGLRWIDPLSA